MYTQNNFSINSRHNCISEHKRKLAFFFFFLVDISLIFNSTPDIIDHLRFGKWQYIGASRNARSVHERTKFAFFSSFIDELLSHFFDNEHDVPTEVLNDCQLWR